MFKRKLMTTLLTATALGSFALGANAASVNGFANAVIQTPLSIAEDVEMDFGTIAPDTAGGVVTLDTADTIPPVAGFVLGGVPASGQFTVTGEGDLFYSISFPGAPFTLDEVGPGTDTLSLDGLNASVGSPRRIPGGPGSGTQTDTFTVGGQLTIGAGQTAGTYRGQYTVQVDYQ